MEGKFKVILMNRIFDCELELAESDYDPLVSYCTYINETCGFSKSGNLLINRQNLSISRTLESSRLRDVGCSQKKLYVAALMQWH